MFTLVYYILILVAVTIFLIATLIVYPLTVPLDPSRRAVHALSRAISMVFLRTAPFWKTKVEGLNNIDRAGRYVIILNHRSMVDIPMLYWTPLNFRWVSKSYIRKMPFIGQYMWLHGDILIPEGNPRRAAEMILSKGRMWLRERGANIAIFPEGTRSKSDEIQRFKVTAFNLAREAGVAILPVVLHGSNVVGKNGHLPWRHNFIVKVLPPISAEEVAACEPKEIMEKTRELMIKAKSLMTNNITSKS